MCEGIKISKPDEKEFIKPTFFVAVSEIPIICYYVNQSTKIIKNVQPLIMQCLFEMIYGNFLQKENLLQKNDNDLIVSKFVAIEVVGVIWFVIEWQRCEFI